MKFGNFRIGARLAGAFGIVLALFVAVAGFALWEIDYLGDVSREVAEHDARMQIHALEARILMSQQVGRAIEAVQAGAERRAALKAESDSARQKVGERFEKLEKLIDDDEAKAAFVALTKSRGEFAEAWGAVFAAAQAGKADEARALAASRLQPASAANEGAASALIDVLDTNLRRSLLAARKAEVRAFYIVAGATAVALLLGALLAFFMARSVTVPLAGAVALADRVAGGDLSLVEADARRDEVGDLVRAQAAMVKSLRAIVGEVRSGTEHIATASTQIAQGNSDLSSRTEQQASSLQETASSMEELSSAVKQSAENARQANQLATQASEVALRGGDVVGQVVDTMHDITESSRRIAEIIAVIDGIAFQTNILALNAAVEAARAGEQGRGFAVVASEVRALAQRSATAAREIKELISNSVEKVDAGSRLVEDAGKTMGDIVQSVRRVTDMIGEITSAATEQSSGIQQVNQAVSQLDQMTQQNAALVEQSTAAAQSLSDSAVRLTQAVTAFRLEGGGVAARPPASAPAPVLPAPPAEGGEAFDMNAAIRAHGQWKQKLRLALKRHESVDAATLRRDDQCAMGRWLGGEGRMRCGAHPLFAELVETHAQFHRAAGDVAEVVNRGDAKGAEALMAAGTPFAETSGKVGEIAMRLRKEEGGCGAKPGARKAARAAAPRASAVAPARANAGADDGGNWEEF